MPKVPAAKKLPPSKDVSGDKYKKKISLLKAKLKNSKAELQSAVDEFYDECESDAHASYIFSTRFDSIFAPIDAAGTSMYDGSWIAEQVLETLWTMMERDRPSWAKKGEMIGHLMPVSRQKFINAVIKNVHDRAVPPFGELDDGLRIEIDAIDLITRGVRKLAQIARKIAAKAAEVPGESKNAALGKWAWPQARIKGAEAPFETDTSVEKEMLSAIVGHFDGDSSITDEVARRLMYFMKKGMYDDVLKPPVSDELYRGLELDVNWLAKILGYKKLADMPMKGTVERRFTFKPKKGAATSWTHRSKIARGFAGNLRTSYPKATAGVMLYALVDDNPNRFISGPDGLYKLTGTNEYKYESETVGLGPIKIWKIVYARFDAGLNVNDLKRANISYSSTGWD